MSKHVGAKDIPNSSNPSEPFLYLVYLCLNSWLSQVIYILKSLIFQIFQIFAINNLSKELSLWQWSVLTQKGEHLRNASLLQNK